jgi:conjugative relaxase-like TrwC/TraI family protein
MHQFRSAREAKDYYTAALQGGDYYTTAEQQARWGGELAKRLGLGLAVTREGFARLADNLHPSSDGALTPRTDSDRTVGYDINFHVPKGVSVLHLVGQDDRILDAIRDSARETMQELERQTRTRVRSGGRDEEREAGELVWGEFLHTTTRPEDGVPDPHLHVHCFTFNATYDAVEGRYKAAQFRDIKRDMPYHEAAFYSRLAWRLEGLGYAVEREGKSWDVAGIPRGVKQRFSRRTMAIESLAKRLGINSPERKAALGALSRSRKDAKLKPEELRSEWLSRMTPDERRSVERVVDRGRNAREHAARPEVAAERELTAAIAHRFERESVVAEPRLLETALRSGLGRFRPDHLRSVSDQHPELLRQREGTQRLVTTRAVLAEEESVLRFARDGRGACATLEGDRPWERGMALLNAQQTRAVEHLLRSRDRVMLLRGGAGTGKTTLLRTAAEAIERRGKRVTVLAPSAEASRGVLRQAGFAEAETIAKFLDDPAAQARAKNGVLWVDEAGLLGTPSMARLFTAAERLSARVVLMGDTRQHAPIERGDALRLLESRAGLVPAEVTAVVRQTGTYRQAVEAMAEGRFDAGIATLDTLGAVRETQGHDPNLVVKEYLEVVKRGQSALLIAPTHAEGEELTSLIRAGLRHEGKIAGEERLVPRLRDLGWTAAERGDAARYAPGQVVQFHRGVGSGKSAFKPGQRFEVTGRDERGQVRVRGPKGEERVLPVQRAASFQVSEETVLRVSPGDQLRATSNGRSADGQHRINNGAVFTVAGFSPEGALRLSNGWEVDPQFGRFDHGYVSTSHAAQGRTVDWVLVAQGWQSVGAASAEQFYVSVSRGRHGCRVFTDDREALVAAVGRLSQRRGAVELLEGTGSASRSQEHAATLVRLRAYEQQRRQGQTHTRNREYGYERS